MKNKKRWIDLALLNLVVVAFLGMTLRSKILFSLPFLDYNHLLDAHEHFAFGGWVTLILAVLMVFELLPSMLSGKRIYQWLFGLIFLSAWGMLISYYIQGKGGVSDFFSTLFIFVTYLFSYCFIKDLRTTAVDKTVKLLAVVGLISLVLSSAGPFTLAYLFSSKSLNAILYRDALFTFLHLQYNGFFTLSVMALLVFKLWPKITTAAQKNFRRFAVLLCLSVLPSLFLSYMWHYPNSLFRLVALAGSTLLLLTLAWFIVSIRSLIPIYRSLIPLVKMLAFLSMTAFMLKLLLHSCTIFPPVGDAVFGDRPMIIGFLHLVFLVFVTLFLLAYLGKTGLLNINNNFTRVAFIVFTIGVVSNEGFLMAQGLGAMFIKSSSLMPGLLWVTSIFLFFGAFLIGVARMKSK